MGDIDLRPSDLYFQAASVLGQVAQDAGQIFRKSYEADRVAQVNRGLTYLERSYQGYNQSLEQKGFTIRQHVEPQPGESNTAFLQRAEQFQPGGDAEVIGRFGQATLADVQADEDEFYQQQLEYINQTITNKAAREEMIQHATAKHLQNRQVVARQWQIASQHEFNASNVELADQILQSDASLPVKIGRMQLRIEEGVNTGRIWVDDA